MCASDGIAPPGALLERFIPADCADCWSDPGQEAPGASTAVIDWIVPAGDDAPLAAAATEDARRRLRSLASGAPVAGGSLLRAVERSGKKGRPPSNALRVARGPAVNDYIGTTIRWRGRAPADSSAWLLLVESIPAGAEGSPVARQLVRNMLVLPLSEPKDGARATTLNESRPMHFPEGARPQRLQTIGWVQDGSGRVLAAAQSECPAQDDAAAGN